MKTLFLIVLGVIGVMFPFLWIVGTITGWIKFIKMYFKLYFEKDVYHHCIDLGYTMADGGKKKK